MWAERRDEVLSSGSCGHVMNVYSEGACLERQAILSSRPHPEAFTV